MEKLFYILCILVLLWVGSGIVADSKTSNNTYLRVSINRQKVFVIKNNQVIREMACSTGLPKTPTPLGTFRITHKGGWFWSKQYHVGCKYYSAFTSNGYYLFHSIPMDAKGNPNPVSLSKLGSPASHGCIRLSVGNAKWIYDNIKIGTPVIIKQQ